MHHLGRRGTVALVLLMGAGCGSGPSPVTQPDTPRYITAGEAIAWPATPHDRIHRYGPAPQNYAELRLPSGPGPHPVAVVIHGGCWLSIADNDYMDRVADALTDSGWATWNLEFRTLDQPGGGWPGTLLDVGAGVDALRDVADEEGLDLGRVVTLGHSSGGHLALWAASRHRIPAGGELHTPDPLPVAAAVGLAAIADLSQYLAMGVSACGDTPARLLGGMSPSEAPERAAQASPAALAPTGIPQLLVSAVDDYVVPPEHGRIYALSVGAAGQEVVHQVVERASHFELVAPSTGAWQAFWPTVLEFLQARSR